MRRVSRGLWIAGVTSAALACGGGSDSSTTTSTNGTNPSGGSVSADQACSDVARARCARLAGCSSLVFAVRYPDEATCESREKANCKAALAAPSTGNSPSAVETCAGVLGTTVDCASFLANTPPAGCETRVGALPNGAACGFDAQCQSTYCSVGLGTLCGTCGSPPAVGGSCAELFCGPGLICAGISKTCGTPVAVGAACDPAPCSPGSVCVGAVGTRRCQAAVSVAAGGQPCGLVGGSRVECAAQGLCKLATGQTSGTCLSAAADGAACDDTNGPLCALPARCVAGTCQLPSAVSCH